MGKKKDLGNCRLVSLTLIFGRVMEQVTLEIIFKHVKDKKVMESSQHGFMKEKIIDLITFDDKIAGLVQKGTSVKFFILYFSRLCKALSPMASSKTS